MAWRTLALLVAAGLLGWRAEAQSPAPSPAHVWTALTWAADDSHRLSQFEVEANGQPAGTCEWLWVFEGPGARRECKAWLPRRDGPAVVRLRATQWECLEGAVTRRPCPGAWSVPVVIPQFDSTAVVGTFTIQWAGELEKEFGMSDLAFDAATDGGANAGTSLTFSHTCTGDERLLHVGFVWSTGDDDVVSVTYNGVAMTLVAKNLTGMNRYLYRLIAPAAGTHDVVITTTGGHTIFGGAESYTGADQTSQPAAVTNSSASGATSLLTSVTTTVNNAWTTVFEGSYNGNPEPGAGTGATKREADAAFGTWGFFDSGAAITPAGSTSMTTTRTSATDREIGHIMVAINPAGGGGATVAGPLVNNHPLKALVGGALVH